MKKPNRISLSLFENELKDLINASAKIFPITQEDVNTGYNPNGYEYGRIGNHIYRWNFDKWEYIIADDTNIDYNTDIDNIPTEFNPKPHQHTEEDIINIDKYTKQQVDDLLFDKADKDHEHNYSPSNHNHDEIYAQKSTEYTVLDHENRLFNIENGYTEGHSHPNVSILNSITQLLIDAWNSAVEHISDATKHITSNERTLWNTVSSKADTDYVNTELSKKALASTLQGHTSSTGIHTTPQEKEVWNNKANVSQIPTKVSDLENDKGFVKITIGTVKPTDGSLWYKKK